MKEVEALASFEATLFSFLASPGHLSSGLKAVDS